MTAKERANELFNMPSNQWPKEAINYVNNYCLRYGGNTEVILAAFEQYAIEIENLQP